MYERFTDRARKVMQLANQEAQRFNHEYIGTEHILLGLVKEGSGVAANVLKNLDIDLRKIRLEVEKIVQSGPDRLTSGRLPQTPRARKVIEYAIEEADSLNHKYVGTEHLLLGLLREEEGVAAQILLNLGLKQEEVREEVLSILGYAEPSPKNPASKVTLLQPPAVLPTSESDQELLQKLARILVVTEKERIRYLEQQLWNVRVLLGAIVGTLAGVLLAGSIGGVAGIILGGTIAALGLRIPSALAGGGVGILLGSVYLGGEGGILAGTLLGGLLGYLVSEIGESPLRRRLGKYRGKR